MSKIQQSEQREHITELIGSLEYGSLKKKGIVPKTTMFTDIQKLGGEFPKVNRKLKPWWFGYYMDRLVRLVLQNREYKKSYLSTVLDQIVTHTGDAQCTLSDLENDNDYFSDVAEWLLQQDALDKSNGDILYEPEWTFSTLMGHPDVVVGDTIFDVKTTGRWNRMRIPTIFQLLSYAAIAKQKGITVKHIGVILPAQKMVKKVSISGWKSDQFLRILEQKSQEKTQRVSIDPTMLVEFSLIKQYIGCHVTRLPTLRKTLEACTESYIFKPIQIFLSGRMKLEHNIKQTDMTKSADYIKANNLKVFVHSPYSINISREHFGTPNKSTLSVDDVMIRQLETTNSFGGSGVVFHLGHKVTMDYDTAYCNMMTNVSVAASFATPNCPLLLETDSGGSILDDPEDLAEFWLNLDEEIQPNVAICVDTCHVFAAGYGVLDTLLMFREKGVPVKLIHYNDSMYGKGSKRDRHAHFGRGLIGHEELISVAKYAVSQDIPLVTE